MYHVIFSKQAVKSLKKIPKDYQIKVKDIVANKLSLHPFSLDLRKLGPEYKASHRLRVGSYRFFLLVDTTTKTIIIAAIERRTSHTYR